MFDRFERELICEYSTRFGGVSGDEYESLNLSLSTDDAVINVLTNYRLWCESLGVCDKHLVMTHQTHGNEVVRVDKSNCGEGLYFPRKRGIDGMVTNVPEVALVTSHADCAPIYIYDPVNRAIGLCHAGWRGTTLEIAKKTVEKLVAEFGSNPAHMYAVIGPCISMEHFECDSDVVDAIRNMPSVSPFKAYRYNSETGKYHVSLRAVNRSVLASSGIPRAHIEIDDGCTYKLKNKYFSHRRDGLKRGGQAAILMIKR